MQPAMKHCVFSKYVQWQNHRSQSKTFAKELLKYYQNAIKTNWTSIRGQLEYDNGKYDLGHPSKGLFFHLLGKSKLVRATRLKRIIACYFIDVAHHNSIRR